MTDRGKPLYMIGVAADLLKVHPQTLRFYEKKGLIQPSRTEGRTRMYSEENVEEIARLLRLTRDLGVNLAGAEIIIKMRRRMLEITLNIRIDLSMRRVLTCYNMHVILWTGIHGETRRCKRHGRKWSCVGNTTPKSWPALSRPWPRRRRSANVSRRNY